MAEKEVQKISLTFLSCPTCGGQGYQNGKHCLDCETVSVIAWDGSRVLQWGKKIDFLHIAQEKLELTVKNTINFLLLLVGLVGVAFLGWFIYDFTQTKFTLNQILSAHDWRLLLFWLSVLTDGYLYYRFQREVEKISYIPKKKFDQAPVQLPAVTWPQAKNIGKAKKEEISKYFNFEAQTAISKAWELANKYDDAYVNPIHLLISLLTFQQTQIIFSRLGIPFNNLKSKIRNNLTFQSPKTQDPVAFSQSVWQIIYNAYFRAYQLRQKKVDVTELLEELANQDNEVKELLYDLNVTSDKIQNVVAWLRIRKQLTENWNRFRRRASLKPKGNMDRAMTAIATPVIDAFSNDMTYLARSGYLMPCVGREQQIEDIFNIMQGANRRSALLVGNPGVGRNTIVEGIANLMAEEAVPEFLQDKRLVSLSIAKLVSGTTPTQAQERLMMIINEIRRSGNIVLYINDIHNMVGISAGQQGSIDLADVLSQALNTNTVLAIASTTPNDYRRYLEGKSSIDNVFQKVEIKEVSGNEAIQILESKVGSFEYKNEVFFSYDAIAQTVKLSERYLHDRYLPEKAIEIIEEVSAVVRQQKGKNAIVTANDVALVVSRKTNIPLTEITQEESAKLLGLEDKIHQRVIDQTEAVKMVSAALRRARAEMRDISRPIVNLLFLGPTGVGKTELAKTVAEVYFGDEKNMIRLDMSEYQEKSSISRLIGAPPGMGSSEGGYLSEAIRKNPFSLILLDELEKAHPDILNIFLQIMDDGRLTDNIGRTIDFTNSIIIATSNAGTRFIQDKVKEGQSVEQIKQQLMDVELHQYFRPEFLNRFDGIIVFKPLSIQNVEEIAKLMTKKVAKNLEEKGITLEVEPQALAELAQQGYDPEFGARPLRRIIQEKVQDPIANELLAGKIGRRDTIIFGVGGRINVIKAKEI
ncbi:MAG: ATP-dependent Clp protease ATP-binding subunit [Candidatus Buchananbacteria bacterium]|nr:ATP-dependent Clp protease ATP-binding subunit [Candidatus Buchananbacteria bacterium]